MPSTVTPGVCGTIITNEIFVAPSRFAALTDADLLFLRRWRETVALLGSIAVTNDDAMMATKLLEDSDAVYRDICDEIGRRPTMLFAKTAPAEDGP